MADKKRISKRNNYTLTIAAQDKIDKVAKKEKSAFVSAAIELFEPIKQSNGTLHED